MTKSALHWYDLALAFLFEVLRLHCPRACHGNLLSVPSASSSAVLTFTRYTYMRAVCGVRGVCGMTPNDDKGHTSATLQGGNCDSRPWKTPTLLVKRCETRRQYGYATL